MAYNTNMLNPVHRVDFKIDIDRVKQLTHLLISTIKIYDNFILAYGNGLGYIIRMQKVGNESHLYVEHKIRIEMAEYMRVHRLDSKDNKAHRYVFRHDHIRSYIIPVRTGWDIYATTGHTAYLNYLYCIKGVYYDCAGKNMVDITCGKKHKVNMAYHSNHFVYKGETYSLDMRRGWMRLRKAAFVRGVIELVPVEVLFKWSGNIAMCKLLYSVDHANSTIYPTSCGFSILGFEDREEFNFTVIPDVHNIGELNMMTQYDSYSRHLSYEVYGRNSVIYYDKNNNGVKHLLTYITAVATMWSRAADPSAAYHDTYIICKGELNPHERTFLVA